MARIIIPQQQRTGGQTTVAVAPRQQAPAQQVVPHNFIGPLLPNQVRAQAPPAQPAQQFSVLPQQPRQQVAPPAPPAPTRQEQIRQIESQIADTQRRLAEAQGNLNIIHQARDAGMAITPQTNVQQARDFIAAQAAAPPIQPDIPPAPVITPEQEMQNRMMEVLRQQAAALAQPPAQQGLTPEERQLFADEKAQLRARYDAALDTLRRQQEQERQRLVGRYAAMGFTEPGVIAGPMAGEPGIVTRGVQELGERQRREIAELEQARAGDVLAATRAIQEAERTARVEAEEQFARRREAMIRNLEQQMGLVRPEQFTVGGRVFQRDRATGRLLDITPPETGVERFTAGGRVFERNRATGVVTDVTPPEALHRQVEVERGGRRLQITIDTQGREVGFIDLGPAERDLAFTDFTDDKGNVTRVWVDRKTGQHIRTENLGKIGRAPQEQKRLLPGEAEL